MSDELRQKEQTAETLPTSASMPTPMVDGRRIDQSHETATSVSTPSLEPLDSSDHSGADSTSPVGEAAARSDELLLQASQIAEHLRSELTELNRREQRLNGQLSVLDQERRNVRLWVSQFEQEIREREELLDERDEEISRRAEASQKLDLELREQDQALTNAREELARERLAMKTELEQELDEDRRLLAEAQQALDEERRQLRQQMQSNQDEHYAALQQAREQLKTDREELKERLTQEALTEDLRQQREAFLKEKSDWDSTFADQRQTLQDERRIHDQALLRAQLELNEVKREQSEQLITDRVQCETDLANARLEHESELTEERKEHDITLQEERSTFERERTEFESQMRFQQEHLRKSRGEFEETKNEFRAEVQRSKNFLLQIENGVEMSKRQLSKRRDLIDNQEESISRERILLDKTRRDAESESVKGRSRLKTDRTAWEQERDAQQAELRRQHDMLTLHAENLEGRRQRLDQLRAELEQTHRTTLEMRMAVEEAWAQFSQAAGESVAKGRVETARQALADHYEHLREAMAHQRQDLEESRSLFLRQKDEFRSERETLTAWIGEREDRLKNHEEELNREAEQLDAQEAVWREARDRWADEKLEAESIIRDLLREIDELTDRPIAEESFPSSPALGEEPPVSSLETDA